MSTTDTQNLAIPLVMSSLVIIHWFGCLAGELVLLSNGRLSSSRVAGIIAFCVLRSDSDGEVGR